MFARFINVVINFPYFTCVSRRILRLFGVDIPSSVKIAGGLVLAHGGMGVVIHPKTNIGMNVKIYQHVTIGRSDVYVDHPGSAFSGISLGEGAVIGAGAVLLTSTHLSIGKYAVIGANSVVTRSIGDFEIWAGNPAKKLGTRKDVCSISQTRL